MTNDFDNTIILTDEYGNDTKLEFLDLIEYDGEEYVVLLPVEEGDGNESGEVVILKLEESHKNDEEVYVSVEDEDALMAVFNIFKEKYKDIFNFVD